MPSDDDTEPVCREIDPDDHGTTAVQSNGTIYVGRGHAGEDVSWWIEIDGDGDDAA